MDPVTLALAKRYTDEKTRLSRRIPVTTPAGFAWTDHPLVGRLWTDGKGRFETDFDVSELRNPGGATYYVDVQNGDDSNDGLSVAAAFKTLGKALAIPNALTIMIAEGVYNTQNTGFIANNIERDVNLIALPGHRVEIINSTNQTWTQTAGKTNTHQTSRSSLSLVLDRSIRDAYGYPISLVRVDSLEAVEDTAGSYYYANNIVYVHTHDSRPPDSDILTLITNVGLSFRSECIAYMEDITVIGGTSAVGIVNSTLYAKRCAFLYSHNNNAVTSLGSDTIFQDCVAAYGNQDGFNYHAYQGQTCRSIEINCVGHHNGLNASADIQNGSTTHDGNKAIRVNCTYYNNRGSNVGDINLGTQSWNIGVVAFDSVAVNEERYHSNFTAHTNAELWLDGCLSYGSLNAMTVQTGATLRYRNSWFEGGETFEGTGKKERY